MALLPENQCFKERNVLNGLNLDDSVYKWMPLKYVISMLQSGKLTFTRIAAWEDVYENYFLKGNVISHGLWGGTDIIQNGMFGQSWSLRPESDALWRIYSDIKQVKNSQHPNYDDVAIRIKTTARKLYDAIYVDDSCMATTYIGRVLYKDQKDIENEMQTLQVPIGNLSREIAEHACVKRLEFDHENEIRPLVSLPTDDRRFGSILLQYVINCDDFIDSFMIDPRLPIEQVQDIANLLIQVGVNPNKISQSQLYHYNPIPLQLV